jgi:hypothetical protein
MTTGAIAAAVLLLLAAFAGVLYACVPQKKKVPLLLWALRVAGLGMLACAFFQPSCTVRTLAIDKGSTAVLIDASKSMGLFKTDSLLSRLAALAGSPGDAPVRFFCFGDSLRRCDPAAVPKTGFTDKTSFFPSGLSKWRTLIILSDGNWSNPSFSPAAFEGKNCYYVPLPSMSPRPFLRSACVSFQTPAIKDSASAAIIALQGFKTTGDALAIEVRRAAKPLMRRSRLIPAGYFSDTVSLRFPTEQTGRYLYGIRISNAADTVCAQMNLVGDVVPAAFTAAAVASSPSLDQRFLSLAISGDPGWKFDGGDEAARTADALFLWDWDAKARKNFSLLKPSGVAVFMGCLPCSTRYIPVSDTFSLIPARPDDSLARRIVQRKLPSPARIAASDRPCLGLTHARLECVMHGKGLRKPSEGLMGRDTLPFLLDGSFGGRSCVALAARDFWHMEFLPLGVDQENENGSVLRDVVAVVREAVVNGLSRAFFAYPLASETTGYDSSAFCFVLPAGMTAPQGASAPGRIGLFIRQNGKRILDTVFTAVPGAPSGVQTIRFGALDAGTYSYDATLFFDRKRLTWADTFDVRAGDLELSIQGQNTVLLEQIAAPINANDPRAVSAAIGRDPSPERSATEAKVYQVKRSWLLWGIIVALFSLEWLLRRKHGLDG